MSKFVIVVCVVIFSVVQWESAVSIDVRSSRIDAGGHIDNLIRGLYEKKKSSNGHRSYSWKYKDEEDKISRRSDAVSEKFGVLKENDKNEFNKLMHRAKEAYVRDCWQYHLDLQSKVEQVFEESLKCLRTAVNSTTSSLSRIDALIKDTNDELTRAKRKVWLCNADQSSADIRTESSNKLSKTLRKNSVSRLKPRSIANERSPKRTMLKPAKESEDKKILECIKSWVGKAEKTISDANPILDAEIDKVDGFLTNVHEILEKCMTAAGFKTVDKDLSDIKRKRDGCIEQRIKEAIDRKNNLGNV